MHEIFMAREICRIVTDELSNRSIQESVEKIRLSLGRVHAIVPQTLQWHFDVLKGEDERLKDATLEIREVPLELSCSQCDWKGRVDEMSFVCQECGKAASVVSSQDMVVESMVVRS